VVVFVDYVGLVRRPGSRSRYEAISDTAEQLKIIARRTNTILIVASQIGRPNDRKQSLNVRLHDARDSGALENSAGLIIGCCRPAKDEIHLGILKNTKGITTTEDIICDFDGPKMRITEQIVSLV
jgi:replicative DNA helicase